MSICEPQYSFMPRQKTRENTFCFEEADGETKRFVDLNKVDNRLPRGKLWYYKGISGLAEMDISAVQDIREIAVRYAGGVAEELKVEVGLLQRSSSSSFLFVSVMDRLTDEVRQDSAVRKT